MHRLTAHVPAMSALALLIALGSPACGGSSDSSADAAVDALADDGAIADSEDSNEADAAADATSEVDAAHPPDDLWTALAEMLAAVRESPDHLGAAADRLVAAGDAVALYELIRDRVAVIPPPGSSVDRGSRWGPRGALRSGTGTPREVAELLADLYRRAGLQAEVVVGQADPASVDLPALYRREVDRGFSLDVDDATWARWARLLAVDTEAVLPLTDPGHAQSRAIAATLKPLLPGDLASAPPALSDARIPLVRVEVDGEQRLANPLVPTGIFGEGYTLDAPAADPTPADTLPVTVRLHAATSRAPTERMLLVEGSWPAAELVGRHVQVQMAPAAELADLVSMRLREVQAFIPLLTVRGADLGPEAAAELAVGGDAITVAGDVLEVSGDEVRVAGRSVGTGLSDPAAEARVASLGVTVEASAFQDVTLRLSALDADGLPVAGLGATSFRVFEDDAPQSFLFLRNQSLPPRVLLLLDTSDSMPPEFSDASAVALGLALLQPVLESHGEAEVRVGAVSLNGADWAGAWTADPVEL